MLSIAAVLMGQYLEVAMIFISLMRQIPATARQGLTMRTSVQQVRMLPRF